MATLKSKGRKVATTKTPKELAEASALAALESLQAALRSEVALRQQLRDERGGEHADVRKSTIAKLENDVRDAEKRSNASFTAWRKSQEAVPH